MKSASRLGRLADHLLLAPSKCESGDDIPLVHEFGTPFDPGVPFDPALWEPYKERAVKRALELGNRGPLRYEADGTLAKDIQEAFWRCGFYVFEGAIAQEEVAEAQREFDERLENAPARKGSKVDKNGNPVKFPQAYDFLVPHDRDANPDAKRVPSLVGNLTMPLLAMESALRLYGHPDMLRINECFNGPDFTPMYCSIFNKEPGIGEATAWHQDGRTHWTEDGRPGRREEDGKPPRQPGAQYVEDLQCHGNSFHVALSNCTPEQCLWVIPGSHKEIYWPHWPNKKFTTQYRNPDGSPNYLVKSAFTSGEIEMIPDAVPMLLKPGDLGVHNRQALHGAFPNTSKERRVTLVCAYYNRRHVMNQLSRFPVPKRQVERLKANGKIVDDQTRKVLMDEAHIVDRSRIIQVAIDARKEKYPDEKQYVFQPFVGVQMPPREEYVKDYVYSFGLDL